MFTGNKTDYTQLVNKLKELKMIKDPFSEGNTKWMGMVKIDKLHRRIDLMFIEENEYPFALLYFTGSQEFNEQFRMHARKKGYTLNEHGIKLLNSNKTVSNKFTSEKDIFDFLDIDYITPENRIQGKFQLQKHSKLNTHSSLKRPAFEIPKNMIQCLKGKGAKGFSINELREVIKKKYPNQHNLTKGTKKEICNVLFPEHHDQKKNKTVFNVSNGVLLADTYKEEIDPTGYIASEKYDGIRALWDTKMLKSRTNKQIHAPEWFINDLPTDHALDGELYIKRGDFEKTTSIVSKKIPIDSQWKQIKYMIFDIPSSKDTFENRLKTLEKLFSDSLQANFLVLVPHFVIKSKNHMKSIFENIVSKGGEGIMLRQPDSKYMQKRSKTLLKVKPTDDAEAVIENMIEGRGKDASSMGAMQVHLQQNPKIKFKIGSGFTTKMRKNFWFDKDKYIGTVITFGYKGFTAKGVPRHPVFIRTKYNSKM